MEWSQIKTKASTAQRRALHRLQVDDGLVRSLDAAQAAELIKTMLQFRAVAGAIRRKTKGEKSP